MGFALALGLRAVICSCDQEISNRAESQALINLGTVTSEGASLRLLELEVLTERQARQ